jgi:hypothetical protein
VASICLTGILGLGAGSYQPIPKLIGGVKRAVSVAAGGDYTLVLTSASVPSMPFRDVFSGSNAMASLKGSTPRRVQMSSVVIPGSWRPTAGASEGVTVASSASSSASRVADASDSSGSDSDRESDDEGESMDESNEGEERDQKDGDGLTDQLHLADSSEGIKLPSADIFGLICGSLFIFTFPRYRWIQSASLLQSVYSSRPNLDYNPHHHPRSRSIDNSRP